MRIVALLIALLIAAPAVALDKVRFATNWRAQAEHGGFYQAVADGTYARYGLDVNILQGGPQLNARLLLAAGRVDFAMGANTIQMFESVQQNVPVVTVASMFQVDPVIFMSHPGVGLDRFEDLPKATAFIASDMRASVWQWLKQDYGAFPSRQDIDSGGNSHLGALRDRARGRVHAQRLSFARLRL
jgi:NitT/TauT family transport system substrate-binding protein